MKYFLTILLSVLIFAGCSADISEALPASDTGKAVSSGSHSVSFEDMLPLPQPVLVTSFGQSPDSMLAKSMFDDLNIDFSYDSMAAPETISEYKSVVIAVGTSVKSLISIGIDPDAELKRCQEFASAIPEEYPVIVMRMGSSQSHSVFSDSIVKNSVAASDIIIVTQSGDGDKTIKKLADESGKSYHVFSQVKDIASFIKELF